MKHTRLNREKWISAGILALRSDGPPALRAEPLARRMGTTKGSFYWHFTDVPAFHAALLDHWKTRAFADVVAQLESDGGAADRLQDFGKHVLDDTTAPAIRSWAQEHKDAADALAQVDAERLTYMATLLTQLGLKNPDFARAAYGALIGMPMLPKSKRHDSANAYTALIDLVLALR
ncbi:TetR/AcrR family transcriptional regulator [Pseudosulfitobacter sp. DSM 107133]|uniref:TetR/AcrR family transcriptional regulator n=1 Tax=Pseudosulfitobacter sp. DSM 107133 TaxID=2883100 RepID=UPI000DF22B85|nr:TetR/AcrR family transcriptional regulator [Pseudosulfitobacter sp. DSM 107133]UOA28379.1 hypothetical protein DSM107133_03126 [Pseudosulfitobacter sp. DSM 107133]